MIFNSHRGALLAVLIACGVAAAACAESVDTPESPPADDPDGGLSTSGDARPDAAVDGAAVDASSDVQPTRSLCTVHGWCHTLLPPSQTLRDVWGDGTDTVWAVSEQGNILRYNGTAWTIAYTTPGTLYAIWGASPTDIWVGGVDGLFHGTGAASASLTWTRLATPTTLPIFDIVGTSATDVWAVAHDAAPVATTSTSSLIHYAGPPADSNDPRNGWTEDARVSAVSGQLSTFWFAGPNDLWVGGGSIVSGSTQPRTWHRTVGDVGGWTRDTTLVGRFGSATFRGAVATDADNILAFGASGSPGNTPINSYNLWGRRSSAAPYMWADAFSTRLAPFDPGCGYQLHYGGQVFGSSDIWLYGDYGRLCHYDGTAWRTAAVSIEDVPFTDPFFGSWASTSDMWVVGQDIAIHKQLSP
jgi:hypothetical protein